MGLLTREELLAASDIKTREVELPSLNGATVRVRGLPAAYSNEANSEALEAVTVQHKGRPQQSMRVNVVKLEALKVLHGLVEPKLNSIEDANTLSQQIGEAWHTIVKAIDDLSGLDEESVKRTEAMFQHGGRSEPRPAAEDGTRAGDDRSAVPVPAGA